MKDCEVANTDFPWELSFKCLSLVQMGIWLLNHFDISGIWILNHLDI